MRLVFVLCLTASILLAQDKPLSGPELIAGAKAGKPAGSRVIRARMEQDLNGKRLNVLNVQIKRRSTGEGRGDQMYQVTYSKNPELKGAALLLHTTPKGFSGSVFMPGKGLRKLSNADRRLNVFGTDMTVDDVLADFFNWTRHDIIGHEKAHDNDCAVIESKPSGDSAGINRVKSWVEMRRYIPWRVEIFEEGKERPVRVEQTERVLRGKSGYWFPREFTISTPMKGTVTKVEGTNSDDQALTDDDFTEAAMQRSAAK
jgi:hypothetical protein